MHRVKIAVCMEDREYRNRFVSCLMKHYQNRVELHVFDGPEEILAEKNTTYEIYLLSAEDSMISLLQQNRRFPILCLQANPSEAAEQTEGMICVEKYQSVEKIMEEVFSHIAVTEEKEPMYSAGQSDMIAVYSLSDSEEQLPFAMTLGAVLAERRRVLLVDFQESSGFSLLMDEPGSMGLDDLLLMAETGSFRRGRMEACIGHRDGMDYIYPIGCVESLYEVGESGYRKLFLLLSQEMNYDTVILNLGMRFPGFLEVMDLCSSVYLLRRKGGLGQWRETEFQAELTARGYQALGARIQPVELPSSVHPAVSLERMTEGWKWNELGNLIRRLCSERTGNGRLV